MGRRRLHRRTYIVRFFTTPAIQPRRASFCPIPDKKILIPNRSMAKPKQLDPRHATLLEQLAATSRTASQVVTELRAAGASVSRTWVAARLRELRGPRRHRGSSTKARPPKAPAPPPLPESPDAIPAEVDLDTLNRWIAIADRAARKAEADGNLGALGTMGRLAKGLVEARRRAMPPPAADPDADPDMRALAEQTVKRLHELVDLVAGEEDPSA